MALSVSVYGFLTGPDDQTAGRWATANITQQDGSDVVVYTAPAEVIANYMIVAVSVTNRLSTSADNVSIAVASSALPQDYEFVEYNSALVPAGTLERTQIVLSPGDKIIVRWGIQYPGNSVTSDDGVAMLVSASTPGDNANTDSFQIESRGVQPTPNYIQGILDRAPWAYGVTSGYRWDTTSISNISVNGQIATVEFVDTNYGTSTPLEISEAIEVGTIVGDTTDGTTLDNTQPFQSVRVSAFDEVADPQYTLEFGSSPDGRLYDWAGSQWATGAYVVGLRSGAQAEITSVDLATGIITCDVTSMGTNGLGFEINEKCFTVEPGSIGSLTYSVGSPLWGSNPNAGSGTGGGSGSGDGSGTGGDASSGGDVGHTGSGEDYLTLTAKTNTDVFGATEGDSIRINQEYWYDTENGAAIPFTVGEDYTIKFFYSGGANSLELVRTYEKTGQIQSTSSTGFRGNQRGDAWNIGLDDTDGIDWVNTITNANGGRWFEFYETAPAGGGGGGGGGGGTPPTYAVTPATDNVDEGSALTINVAVTGVPGGSTLYWSVTRQNDFTEATGSFTVQSGAGQFTVTPLEDVTTEDAETFTVSIRTDSVSGTIVATSDPITINDTSLDTPAPVIGPDGSTLDYTTTGTSDPILDPKINETVNGQEIDGYTYTINGVDGVANSAQNNFTVGNDYIIEFFYNDGANSVQLTRTFEFVGTDENEVRHGTEEVTTNGFRTNRRGDTWTIGDGPDTAWISTLQNATGTCWFEFTASE